MRYAGEILSLPGIRVPSLLDPRPLGRNLSRWIDWPALHANVAAGSVAALAVVATAVVSGGTCASTTASRGAAGTSTAAPASTPRSNRRSTSAPSGWSSSPPTRSGREHVRSVPMDFSYGTAFETAAAEAYERLLGDAIHGDQTLFLREDPVARAWEIVAPALKGSHLCHSYPAGTWGPAAAEELIAPRSWDLR